MPAPTATLESIVAQRAKVTPELAGILSAHLGLSAGYCRPRGANQLPSWIARSISCLIAS